MGRSIIVTGAGGFIGSHLARSLKEQGNHVIGIDVKYPEYMDISAVCNEFIQADLRNRIDTSSVIDCIDDVYALAAEIGGMGYIAKNHVHIMDSNLRINLNTLQLAQRLGAKRYLYTSSACVYPKRLQTQTDVAGLKESDAIPVEPSHEAYSWEKMFTEIICDFYAEETATQYKYIRFHNIYGPRGTWNGGREKAPAALCRKVAVAKLRDHDFIEVWGDGEQTRSFMFIDDCITGLHKIMAGQHTGAINLGTDHLISINDLAYLIMDVAGLQHRLEIKHISGPQGVRGRNSDNSLLQAVTNWTPEVSLRDGLTQTYYWIEAEVAKAIEAGELE